MVTRAEAAGLGLDLDRAAGRRYPLGRQVVDELRRRVQAGTLGPGERLPPVRGLATLLGVTPETVAGAYKRLVEEGYLRGEIGRGTFVAAPPLRAEEDPLAPFEAGGALPPFASASVAPGPPAQRDLLRLANQPGLVSFAASVAALELAPVEALQYALSSALSEEGAQALQVGATQGYPPLRSAIAELLKQRGLSVDASAVCVTSGCQQGIDLAAKVFVGAGDTVLVEQPSFLGALEAFRARGARVIGVPIEGDGLRVEALPALIQRHHPKLLYCMPTYQNPTGRSLSPDKRRALLRLAATYDLPIVEDDSAGFIHLQGDAAPPSLKAEDHAGYVIHLGTFSKLIAAGLRLGWLVADPPVFDKLVAAKYASDLSSDALVQRGVHRLLGEGALQAHLVRVRGVYRERRDVLVEALRRPRALPPGASFEPPEGGFNLWLELPRGGLTSTELFLEAVRRGVAFVPGSFFFSAGGGGPAAAAALYGLRLSYSALAPADLERGVRLLSEAWRGITGASRTADSVVY
ncbi:MAG: PLP-dependent aminotransferase family protein [Chloroflexota bacterium]|nr:PLP-dependent aminotransferase family protein [Chloroflexota bacterium]